MDYWGVSNFQALKYILANDEAKHINVTTIYPEILQNNIDMLEKEDRSRLTLVHPDSADYFITNFRFHPDDFFPASQEYFSDKVLNSTVIRGIYDEGTYGAAKVILQASENFSLAFSICFFFCTAFFSKRCLATSAWFSIEQPRKNAGNAICN